jgi:2-keto-3-deoxy-L-fuconate dehydrogenase
MRLKGKRALVTAAGAGIGRATALAFAAEGAEVIATDINAELLGTLRADRLTTRQLDVRDRAAVAALGAEVGTISVLFNCAGFVHHGTILECDEDAWAFSIDLNLSSMYRVTRAVLPGMITGGGGSIVNVASVASSIKGVPNRFVYGASKAGVIGLTRAIAVDFVGRGIRCNAICPGTVDSPSLQGRMRAQGDYEAARRAFVARQPMGRLGTVEEIAALAVYLASDESAFTTGVEHIIDGGMTNG